MTTAGNTTVRTSGKKGTSTPITNMATDKKMTPDNKVPAPASTVATGSLLE